MPRIRGSASSNISGARDLTRPVRPPGQREVLLHEDPSSRCGGVVVCLSPLPGGAAEPKREEDRARRSRSQFCRVGRAQSLSHMDRGRLNRRHVLGGTAARIFVRFDPDASACGDSTGLRLQGLATYLPSSLSQSPTGLTTSAACNQGISAWTPSCERRDSTGSRESLRLAGYERLVRHAGTRPGLRRDASLHGSSRFPTK
jgi:hypothetical protein